MSRNADIKRLKINGRIKTRDQCIYTGQVTELDCGCVSTIECLSISMVSSGFPRNYTITW